MQKHDGLWGERQIVLADIAAIVDLVAAVNGLLIGALLFAQERFGPTRTRLQLGGFLVCVSLLLICFVLFDRGMLPVTLLSVAATNALGLLTSALFLGYVRDSLSPKPFSILLALPAPLYFVAAMVFGGGAPWLLSFPLVIAAQILFTIAAVYLFIAKRASLPPAWSRRQENTHLPMFLVGMGLVHLAQVIRMLFPQSTILFDVVPLVGALGVLVFVAYAVMGSQTITAMTRPLPQPRPASGDVLERIAALKSHLDPDISLARVAADLGMTSRDLSGELNSAWGKSFREVINDLRIKEALRLLNDPAERATSVEAIGLLSGFRSRSSFYDAFKARTGKTPRAFRQEHGDQV